MLFTGFWLGGPKVREHWEDLGVGESTRLKRTLGRKESVRQTGFCWLRIGFIGELCEYVMKLRLP